MIPVYRGGVRRSQGGGWIYMHGRRGWRAYWFPEPRYSAMRARRARALASRRRRANRYMNMIRGRMAGVQYRYNPYRR